MTHIVAMTLGIFLVSGCADKPKPATQIVAKVNNDEISVHQVNNALAMLQQVSPENIDKARREVLANLVNQQLTVQQAINQKLDRSPDVMMQIEATKREILARAYLSQIVSALPKPSNEEVKKFYDEHPELFTQRRIYNLQEFFLQNPRPPIGELQKLVSGKSMADIAAELKQQNIAYTSNSGTHAAEEIALPVLATLSKLEEGQTTVIETPQFAAIVHVDTAQLSPVKGELAMQRISQYLMSERIKVAVNDNLEHLKSKAKIEYMNEFKNDIRPADASNTAIPTIQPVTKSMKAPDSVAKGLAGTN